MTPLFLNDILLLDEKRYRVIHIEHPLKLYGFPLDERSGLPVAWTFQELRRKTDQSRLKVIAAPDINRPLARSPLAERIGEIRWSQVHELVEKHSLELMERATRAKAIAAHCELMNISDRHVMTLLRLIWRYGNKKSSLIAEYHNCGRVTTETSGSLVVEIQPPTGKSELIFSPSTQRARGRRPTHKLYEPYSYPEGLKEILVNEVRQLYLEDEIVSIRDVQDKVLKKFFCQFDSKGEVLRDEKDLPIFRPDGERPTNRQLSYLIKKAVPLDEAHARRVGNAFYRNNVAPSDGTVFDDCIGPGDVYEIDATIFDVWLTSRYHRSVIVGKPTLYLVVDRFSDLIVGFYLSLRKPSWEGARRAILSISSDWEELCKQLGVKYRASDWPAHRVFPNRFFTDRGEGLSEKSNVVVDIAGFEVTTAPGASPRLKCRVEGGFSTTPVPIKDNVGGYEPPKNAKARMGKKYFKDACYSLDEFAVPIIRGIIKHNRTVGKSSALDPTLVYEAFEPSPINVWNREIERSMGRASRHDFEVMRQLLLPVGSGRTTAEGISYGKLLYQFDLPIYKAWCAWANRGMSKDLIVQYDPGRAGEIWVSEKSAPTVIHRATLITAFRALADLSWEEVLHFQDMADKADRKAKETNQALRVGFSLDTEAHDTELRQRAKDASQGVGLGTRLDVGKLIRPFEEEAREREHLTGQTATSVAIQGFTPPTIDGAAVIVTVTGQSTANPPPALDDEPPKAKTKKPSRNASTTRLLNNLLGMSNENGTSEIEQ